MIDIKATPSAILTISVGDHVTVDNIELVVESDDGESIFLTTADTINAEEPVTEEFGFGFEYPWKHLRKYDERAQLISRSVGRPAYGPAVMSREDMIAAITTGMYKIE